MNYPYIRYFAYSLAQLSYLYSQFPFHFKVKEDWSWAIFCEESHETGLKGTGTTVSKHLKRAKTINVSHFARRHNFRKKIYTYTPLECQQAI